MTLGVAKEIKLLDRGWAHWDATNICIFEIGKNGKAARINAYLTEF
jgi:hypothetical protein